MGESVGNVAVRGVFWTGGGQAIRQIIQVVGSVTLARLLAPDDFGLLGMAMFFIGIGQLFADFGIGSAIVQTRANDQVVLSSCFWLNFAVALALSAALLIASPLISEFYKRNDLTPLLAVLSFNLLLAGVQVVPRAVLNRDMRFADLARIQVFGSLGGAAVAIMLAWWGLGVWALAAQPIVGSSLALAASLIATKWRPRIEFSWPNVAPLAHFSFPLLGIGVVSYTYRNADSVLVGRFIGAAPLGLYSMAVQLMLYPLQQVSSVFVQVLFPTLVQIQDDVPRMRSAYLRTVGAIALVTFPMMGGLFAVADDFVAVVFGPAWVDMAPVLKVFALVGMMQSVVTTVGTIYLSTGKTGLAFRVTLLGAPLLIGGMAAGLPWGIFGVALGYGFASYALSYYSLMQAFRLIHLRLRQMFAVMARPFAAMLAMVAVVFAVRWAVDEMPDHFRLAIAIASGVVAYGVFSLLFNRAQLLEIARLLVSLRAHRASR